VPGEVARGRIEEAALVEFRLARAMLDSGVIDDEGQIRVIERRFFHVGRVGHMAQGSRLRCITLVDTKQFKPQLSRLFVKGIR